MNILNNLIAFLVFIFLPFIPKSNCQSKNMSDVKVMDSVITTLQKKIDKNPNLLEPKIELAEYYFNLKKYDKAEQVYENISKHKKIDFKSLFNWSYSLSMLGKYDKSREILLKLKSNPEAIGNGDLNILLEHNINANDITKREQKISFWTLDSITKMKSSIILEPEILSKSKTYLGSVVDEETNNFLDNVWVYLKNLENGEEKKVMTNKYGEYTFMLQPETDYQIRCYKNGYQSLFFNINTGTGDRKTILGEKKMKKINLNDLEKLDVINTIKYFIRPGNISISNIPEKVFMIQLGILNELSLDQNLFLSRFSNIIKEPYLDTEFNLYRVGVFVEESYARECLDSIKNAQYFKDAFLVPIELKTKEAKQKSLSLLVLKNKEIKSTKQLTNELKSQDFRRSDEKNDIIISENDNITIKKNLFESKDSIISYKIQLGAFKKADESKFKDLSSIGKVEKWVNSSNGLTYYFISEFIDINQAEKVKNKVIEKGIKGAYVVKFMNGQRIQ